MKTEEQIVSSLKVCSGSSGDCRNCAYANNRYSCRMSEMMKDAVKLIQLYRRRVNKLIKRENENNGNKEEKTND